jgi:hypothetical protein
MNNVLDQNEKTKYEKKNEKMGEEDLVIHQILP